MSPPLPKKMAVLTCGGVCPGLNDVVRAISMRAEQYHIPLHGITYGFKGFQMDPIELRFDDIKYRHLQGVPILGTSRDRLNVETACSFLEQGAYDAIFIIGGNGGNTAAYLLNNECRRRNMRTRVIALPKSIDNDIANIDKCFGFDTAVEEARKFLLCAKVEAAASYNGVVIVKLMGRDSGFIATHASIASGVTDVTLIPEVPFSLPRLTSHLQHIINHQGHVVICVAEGIPHDVYSLSRSIKTHLNDVYMKVIDPSYLIRSVPTISSDHIYCTDLGIAAVDAAIQGHTGVTVATKNGKMTYFDTWEVIRTIKTVDPSDTIWKRLCQPDLM